MQIGYTEYLYSQNAIAHQIGLNGLNPVVLCLAMSNDSMHDAIPQRYFMKASADHLLVM